MFHTTTAPDDSFVAEYRQVMNFVFVTVLVRHALSFWNDRGADIGNVFWSPSRTFSQQSSSSKGYHYQWHGKEDFNVAAHLISLLPCFFHQKSWFLQIIQASLGDVRSASWAIDPQSLMDYWSMALEGEGSNCFSITQPVRQKKAIINSAKKIFIWE